jgi:hypothetical protein
MFFNRFGDLFLPSFCRNPKIITYPKVDEYTVVEDSDMNCVCTHKEASFCKLFNICSGKAKTQAKFLL